MIRASNPETMPPCAHGRLVIESAGEHGLLVLNEIPSVAKVQTTLFQLSRTSRPGWPGKTASRVPRILRLWTA